jgi:hypothetical protein
MLAIPGNPTADLSKNALNSGLISKRSRNEKPRHRPTGLLRSAQAEPEYRDQNAIGDAQRGTGEEEAPAALAGVDGGRPHV